MEQYQPWVVAPGVFPSILRSRILADTSTPKKQLIDQIVGAMARCPRRWTNLLTGAIKLVAYFSGNRLRMAFRLVIDYSLTFSRYDIHLYAYMIIACIIQQDPTKYYIT